MALYPSPSFQNVVLLEEPTIPTHAATKAYVDSRAAVSATKAVTLIVSATIGAAATDILYASVPTNLMVLEVASAAAASNRNYTLELFDGNPAVAGVLLYQATGITGATFSDVAGFYMPMPTTLYARITNIDAIATTANITLRYIQIS